MSLISDYLNTLFEQSDTIPKTSIITGHGFLNIGKDSLADNIDELNIKPETLWMGISKSSYKPQAGLLP